MIEQLLKDNTEALNNLAAAIREAGGLGAGKTTTTTSSKTTTTSDSAADDKKGPFLWANNDAGTFGEEKTFAALTKKLKEDKKAARITQDLYDQLVANAEEDGDGDEGDDDGEEGKVPTEDDIKKTFGGFLKIDDEAKREKRKAFVATLLEQFGVERATLLKPEHRAEAISFIERILGGERVDPKTANKGGKKEEADDDMV